MLEDVYTPGKHTLLDADYCVISHGMEIFGIGVMVHVTFLNFRNKEHSTTLKLIENATLSPTDDKVHFEIMPVYDIVSDLKGLNEKFK